MLLLVDVDEYSFANAESPRNALLKFDNTAVLPWAIDMILQWCQMVWMTKNIQLSSISEYSVINISMEGFVISTVRFTGNIRNINGLMQERSNSIANALELYLSCTNPSILSGVFIFLSLLHFSDVRHWTQKWFGGKNYLIAYAIIRWCSICCYDSKFHFSVVHGPINIHNVQKLVKPFNLFQQCCFY